MKKYVGKTYRGQFRKRKYVDENQDLIVTKYLFLDDENTYTRFYFYMYNKKTALYHFLCWKDNWEEAKQYFNNFF